MDKQDIKKIAYNFLNMIDFIMIIILIKLKRQKLKRVVGVFCW